jgi:hypothetical protein
MDRNFFEGRKSSSRRSSPCPNRLNGVTRFSLPISVTLGLVTGLLTLIPTRAGAIESPMEAEAGLQLACVKTDAQYICQPTQGSALTSTEAQVTATVTPSLFSPAEQAMLSDLMLGLAYLLPVGLGLSLFLSDRYAHYRTAVMKHQVETLERIWQQTQP